MYWGNRIHSTLRPKFTERPVSASEGQWVAGEGRNILPAPTRERPLFQLERQPSSGVQVCSRRENFNTYFGRLISPPWQTVREQTAHFTDLRNQVTFPRSQNSSMGLSFMFHWISPGRLPPREAPEPSSSSRSTLRSVFVSKMRSKHFTLIFFLNLRLKERQHWKRRLSAQHCRALCAHT